MNIQDRKKVFNSIKPFVNQGMNADKLSITQYEKMVSYGTDLCNQFKDDVLVIHLVNSILAMFDDIEQIER